MKACYRGMLHKGIKTAFLDASCKSFVCHVHILELRLFVFIYPHLIGF